MPATISPRELGRTRRNHATERGHLRDAGYALVDGRCGVAQTDELARAASNPRCGDKIVDVLPVLLRAAPAVSFDEFTAWSASGRRSPTPARRTAIGTRPAPARSSSTSAAAPGSSVVAPPTPCASSRAEAPSEAATGPNRGRRRTTSSPGNTKARRTPTNGAPACRPHNRARQRGYRVMRDDDGHWHTYRPDGTEIT